MQNLSSTEAYAAGRSPAFPCATSSVAWPAIIAGAFAATGLTFVLFFLGSSLGFAATLPWEHSIPSDTTMTAMAAIWLILVQWVASGFGGYMTGRLRVRWMGAHHHEVFFRDTVHGFLTWAVATVVAALLAAGLAGAAMHHERTYDGVGRESSSISKNAAEAQRRVDVLSENSAAGEKARKDAALRSLFICLSLMIGAFIASAAGALGGQHRDIHSETGMLRAR